MDLLLGAVTGVVFGVLLQKAQVLRFDRQVGFLLLQDMTIIKFMLSAILVGAVGMTVCQQAGLIAFKIKPLVVGAQVVGGVLFGAGWAIAGFCPGTAVGAVAEGRVHALWVVLGMLAGAAVYAECYPFMRQTVLTWGVYGRVPLSELLHLSHWTVVGMVWCAGVGVLGLVRVSTR